MALTPEQIEKAIEYLIRASSFNAAGIELNETHIPDPRTVNDIVARVRRDIGLNEIAQYFNPGQN